MEVEMLKKFTPLWRKAHFQVKMHKTPQSRTAFGSCDEANFQVKMYKAPGFGPLVDDSMAIRYRKRTHSCGETHIWKSKVLKIVGFELTFEVSVN